MKWLKLKTQLSGLDGVKELRPSAKLKREGNPERAGEAA